MGLLGTSFVLIKLARAGSVGRAKTIITDHVWSSTEGYVFTAVCLLIGGGGTPRYLLLPQPGLTGEGVPQGTYPPARSGRGKGVPQGTYLPLSQVRIGGGGTLTRYLPPPPPPPRDRTAYGVLDIPRSVCLLRSCRRTFLLILFFEFVIPLPVKITFSGTCHN